MSFTGKLLIGALGAYPINLYFDNQNESGVVPPPPLPNFLLLESGGFLLLEDGGNLQLEN